MARFACSLYLSSHYLRWTDGATSRAANTCPVVGSVKVSTKESPDERVYLADPDLHRTKRMSGRVLRLVLVFLALAIESVAGQILEPQNPGTESIRGTVINSITHEPIGRALVSSPDNRFATMTDSAGHFEFSHSVPSAIGKVSDPGQYGPAWLMARKPGFVNDPGARTSIQNAAGNDLTISLTPEALIVGRVLLPTSDFAERIQVELYRRDIREGRAHWVSAGTTASRSNGEFRFADLRSGSYKLLTRELMDRDPLTFDPQGQLYGYPPVYFPNAASFSSAETIHLSAGRTFQANVTVVRQPYYPVNVRVLNVQGGMNVTVFSHDGGPGYSLGYDMQKQAIVGMLPNGNYTVVASTYGESPATGLVSITVRGAAIEGVRMVLTANRSIPVNVKEEFTSEDNVASNFWNTPDGQPFSLTGPRRYMNIFLEAADDFGIVQRASLHNPTGPQDEALFIENVRPGRYWIRLNSSRGYASSVTYGDTDLQRQPLVVGWTGSSTPIEITMRDDGASVEGVVEGVAGQHATGVPQVYIAGSAGRIYDSSAHVYLVPESGGDFREGWVSPEGKFSLQQVPPGTYRVLAFDRPQPDLEYGDAEAMRAYETKGQVVRLSSGQKEHLQLQEISTSE